MEEYRGLVRSTRESIDILLDLGADVHATDVDGNHALHFCSKSVLWYQCIANIAPELVNIANNAGIMPLQSALKESGHIFRHLLCHAEVLVTAGADPNIIFEDGKTALHSIMGATWGLTKDNILTGAIQRMFRRMVDMGVHVNAKLAHGETPIFQFFREGDIRMDDISRNSARDEGQVYALFDRVGVDWTAVNKAGESLLYIVAGPGLYANQPKERFQFLLTKGLDPWLENNRHRTPLDVAARGEDMGGNAILELYEGERKGENRDLNQEGQ